MKYKLISATSYLIVFIVLISVISISIDFAYSASVSQLLKDTGDAALYDTSATDPATLVGGIIKVFISFLGVFFVGLKILITILTLT